MQEESISTKKNLTEWEGEIWWNTLYIAEKILNINHSTL